MTDLIQRGWKRENKTQDGQCYPGNGATQIRFWEKTRQNGMPVVSADLYQTREALDGVFGRLLHLLGSLRTAEHERGTTAGDARSDLRC